MPDADLLTSAAVPLTASTRMSRLEWLAPGSNRLDVVWPDNSGAFRLVPVTPD